jgi:hypothetical protein
MTEEGLMKWTAETEEDYRKAIETATTPKELQKAIEGFGDLAEDALAAAKKISKTDFLSFRKGLQRERDGVFAGKAWNKKFGAILLPKVMLEVSMLAVKYKVPFGTAYNRLKLVRPEALK